MLQPNSLSRPRSIPSAALLALAVLSLPFAQTLQAKEVGLQVGESYRYEVVEATQAEGAAQPDGVVQFSMPKPQKQTITVVETVACGEATCLVLEAEQELQGLGLSGVSGRNTSRVRAKIEPKGGDLIEIERLMEVGGQTHARTTRVKSRNSVFVDFYGPWMWDAEDGWQETYELPHNRERGYKVLRRDTVKGRDCLVIERTTDMPDGSTQSTLYWVDAERRIAVEVRQGDWRLVLAEVITGD